MGEEIDDLPVLKKTSNGYEKIYSQGDDLPVIKKKLTESNETQSAPTNGVQEVSTSDSQTVVEPSLESGGKDSFLAEANKNFGKPTEQGIQESNFQQGIIPKVDLKAKQVKLATKQLEKNNIQSEAAKHYNAIEDNSQYPVMQEIGKLLEQRRGSTDLAEIDALEKNIAELRAQPVDDSWRKSGKVQIGENDFYEIPNLKKSAYKTYGEMEDATNKASEKFTELKGKADLLDAELTPAIQQSRNDAAYVPDGKDEQGNEYVKLNPMQSFVEGFGGSVDAIGLGLKKLNPLYSREELKNDLKIKYLRDNVLFPKQADGVIAQGTEMLGGVAPLMATGAVGATGIGAMAVNALTFGTMDLGGGMFEGFAEGKAKGMDDDDAMAFADKIGIEKGITGTVLGATMPMQSALGRKIFINKAEAGALKTFLAEQGVMVPAFMSKTLIDNLGAKAVGSDRDVTEGVAEAGASAFMIGAMTHAIATIPKLPKATKNIFEKAIGKNYKALGTVINKAVQEGAIDAETGERIAENAKAYETIGKDLEPKLEEKILPKQIEIDNLQKKNEGKSGAFVEANEGRIEELNKEIREELGTPLNEKEQKEYDKLIEKRDATDAEGKKEKLLQSEKNTLDHYKARIKNNSSANNVSETPQRVTYKDGRSGLLVKDAEGNIEFIPDGNSKSVTFEKGETTENKSVKQLGFTVHPKEIVAQPNSQIVSGELKVGGEVLYKGKRYEIAENKNAPEGFKKDADGKVKVIYLKDADGNRIVVGADNADGVSLIADANKLAGNKVETVEQNPFTREKQQGEVGGTETFDKDGKKITPKEEPTPKKVEVKEEPIVEPPKAEVVETPVGEKFSSENKATKEKPYTSKNGKFNVFVDKSGEVVAEAVDGREVTSETKRAYVNEFKENYKYDTGKDFEGVSESVDQLIDQSTNPAEIADAVLLEPKYIPEDLLDYTQRAIANNIGRVKTNDYFRITGNKGKDVSPQVRRAYLSEKGNSLDMIAMEAEREAFGDYDAENPRITEQDVVDFMEQHDNPEAFWKQKNPIFEKAQKRFKELTGLKLDDKTIKLATDEKAKRESGKGLSDNQGANVERPTSGIGENAKKASESLPEKVKGKDKIARGLDKLTDALNTKNKIIGEEERPKVIDALRDIAEGMMEEFKISADQAIAKLKDYIKGKISDEDFDSVKDDVKAALESSEGKKKTLVTERAYEGEIREGVKKELEKIGLTRDIDKLDVAQEKAKQFVKSVGEETALDAVRNGDVDGATAAFVFHEVTESLNRKAATSTDAEEVTRLEKIQAELLDEWGNRQWKSGAFNSAMQKILVESDLGYNLHRKVQEYKDVNNGEIPAEVEARFREYDAQLKEVNKKLVEAEERAKKAEEEKALADIKESIEREKKSKRYTAKAKEVADEIRKLKSKPIELRDENGNIIDLTTLGVSWNDIVESIAKAVEAGGKIADVINDVLKDAEWYGNLTDKGREAVRKQLEEKIRATIPSESVGKINVSHSLIRDLVESGIDNIDDLTKAIQSKYPKLSEREVRDAITGYGKISNPNREEVEVKIRKIKRIGKAISALEDVRNKKRPLRSGQQRDKLDAEERALNKELREAMKELPVEEADLEAQLKTQLDAAKQRTQNQIEDLQREIEKGELTPKSARSVKEDAELKDLKEKRDALKKEHEAIFKDEEYKEAKRLELTKKNTERRIEDLQRRLRESDFSKRERKPLVSDSELTKLKAEKLRIQGEYDKEVYKAKLKNRTTAEKIKDSVLELWGIPRVLMATGEMSFVGIQGLKLTNAFLLSKRPQVVAQAFKNAFSFMKSEKNADNWLREIKSQEWYPTLKQSKLALTEPHAELTAREELFYSGWSNLIWDGIGRAITSPARLKSAEAYTKAQEFWNKLNPLKAIERGAVGYLDTLRVERFLDGKQILEMQGKTFENSPQDYKDVSDAINTMTGRASLGGLEQQADLLSKVFFSPRNWASGIKTATPYALYHFGKMTPTARKMAIADFSKFLGLTTGMVMMAAAKLNNDDDKETGVEFDPRSTDFMKIKLGNIRVDPWGGMQQQVVLSSRLMADGLMRTMPSLGITGGYKKDGEVMPLGISHKSPSAGKLIGQQALNKLNPTADLLYNYLNTTVKKDGTRTNDFGQEYTVKSELEEKFHPIFWSTVSDLLKEDPNALNGLLAFYAFFGGGVNVYETKKEEPKQPKYKTPNFGIKKPKFGN